MYMYAVPGMEGCGLGACSPGPWKRIKLCDRFLLVSENTYMNKKPDIWVGKQVSMLKVGVLWFSIYKKIILCICMF